MQPTRGRFDMAEVDGINVLINCIDEIESAPDREARIDRLAEVLLNGHEGSTGYITFGNNKVAKSVGIFNMNSATDCPNADSSKDNESDTGVCQVPWEDCYAHVSENIYPEALAKRRRQQYLWDNVDAATFAGAVRRVKERKRSAFDALRLSESGDFRHNGDIYKAEEIARRLDGEIEVYTYSASHKLSGWEHVEHMTVNQSNNLADYGDRRFIALPEGSDLPDNTVWCPFDYSDKSGDERPKCGECRLCINDSGPNVAIELH